MNTFLKTFEDIAKASIDSAHSLPFESYTNPELFTLEQQQIFQNDWVFACAESALEKPGQHYAFDLAGEAVVIIRQTPEKLIGLSNICRHRGTLLLDEGFGEVGKHIVCPYHAWAYDQEGSLKAVPMQNGIQLDKEEHCLPKFTVDTYMGLVFIHLKKPKQSLEFRLQGLSEYCQLFEPERFTKAYHGAQETWHANWKLAVENGIESYHLFKVHKNTLETTTPSKQAYYVAGSPEWTITGGKMVDASSKWSKWFRSSYPEVYNHYLLIFLPPGFIGIMTYESFDWIQVRPHGHDQCSIHTWGISTSSQGSGRDAEFVKAFYAEDKWICERVQKSMTSQLSRGGKLVELERIVTDFHQYLAKRLCNTDCGEFYKDQEKSQLFKPN